MNEIIQCRKCNALKPTVEFNKNFKICIECNNERLALMKENQQLVKSGSRICSKCMELKNVEYFRVRLQEPIKYRSTCIDCETKRVKEHEKKESTKELKRNLAKKYRNAKLEDFRKREKIYRAKFKESVYGFSKALYQSAKTRAKERFLEFSVPFEQIYTTIKGMKCQISGLQLTLEKLEGCRTNPLRPSIDRIDSTIGYTPENTRVVCWWYNVMKQDWSDETVKFLIKEYIKNNERE